MIVRGKKTRATHFSLQLLELDRLVELKYLTRKGKKILLGFTRDNVMENGFVEISIPANGFP
ncbi:MAG: hypothetical protein DI548_05635 [Flavobacterium johnsoniae]|nr:MAG: hypothetical protein DI548_05635 [Flavobacterium johnsoniae]